MKYDRCCLYLILLAIALCASGCLAIGSEPQAEEMGYDNFTLIEDFAASSGITVVKEEMPLNYFTERTYDEASFLALAKKRNATVIYVITMPEKNILNKRNIAQYKRYMAMGNGGEPPIILEKKYLDPDYPRHIELSPKESEMFYNQNSL